MRSSGFPDGRTIRVYFSNGLSWRPYHQLFHPEAIKCGLNQVLGDAVPGRATVDEGDAAESRFLVVTKHPAHTTNRTNAAKPLHHLTS
jgi:hypothetical protein